jgi:HK97 family phage portal protein
MSLRERLLTFLVGDQPLNLPRIDALGGVGEFGEFLDLQDPNLRIFLQDGRGTASGSVINERVTLKNSAAHRAVSIISGTIGMLPCHLYKLTDFTRDVQDLTNPEKKAAITTQGAEKAKDHPVYRLLMKKPNAWMTPFEFKSYMVQRALFEGITYAVKRKKVSARSPGGFILQELIPLKSSLVEPKQERDWRLHFIYHDPNGSPIDIPMEDMFWFRSPISSDGVTGSKLLDVAAEAIGLAQTSERASARVLKNGAIVGGVLEHPKALSDDAINRLRTQFEERQSTPENAGKWLVAEDGLKVSQGIASTLKDAQSAELRKFQIEELGRFTGVPRPLLNMDETSWGTGIEQLGIFLIMYCLLPWFVEIEEAISRSLLSEVEQDQYFAKFNDGALLRGSLKDQAEFFAKALGSGGSPGWHTQNEVREKFNLNPMEGGDELPKPSGKAAPDAGGDNVDNPPQPAPKPKPQGD